MKKFIWGYLVGFILASVVSTLYVRNIENKYKDYIPHGAIPFPKVQLNDLGFYDTLTYNDYDEEKREDVVRKYRLVTKDMCYDYDCTEINLVFKQIEVEERK